MTSLLNELLELEQFAEGPDACVFEADLWDKFGKMETLHAIDSGLLEHRRIKFRDGHGRCVCWLSDKGREIATAERKIIGFTAN